MMLIILVMMTMIPSKSSAGHMVGADRNFTIIARFPI
jgi:hypothetical protein